MRVSRQWRNVQALKRAGLAHEPNRPRKPGDLAIFCPTCPQPGVNVPLKDEWLEEDRCVINQVLIEGVRCSDGHSRVLYRPQLVVDGNMKLQHLKMRWPEDDVALRDGEGHMVSSGPYMAHLRTAPDHKEVG